MSLPLNISTTHTLTVTLTDAAAAAVTGAVVTVTMVDTNGTALTGQSWPLTLADQTDGTYTGTIPAGINVSAGGRARAQITATKSGAQAYSETVFDVVVDTED